MKVVAPAKGCVEVDGLSGRRYRAKNGIYDMSPQDAKALVKFGGFLPSLSGTFKKGVGYRCPSCGFGSYFKTCSRCGAEGTREGTNALQAHR